jgi:hypothetical protein
MLDACHCQPAKDLREAEAMGKKCKKQAEKKKETGARVQANIENCGKVTTYGKSKKKALSKRGDAIQYHRDHIPASEYMIQKAKMEIATGKYDDFDIDELNPDMEKAIVCQAPVIILPSKIHQVGHTYGETSSDIIKRGDLKLSPNLIKRRDMGTYKNALRSRNPIDKKGKQLKGKKKEKNRRSK